MKQSLYGLITGMIFFIATLPAFALNVVLTNDDGFETENIQALYRALREAGHNVIMAAPYLGQSGAGGKISFVQPILPTSEPSEGGLLLEGSFGIGETTIDEQQYYVDSSPVAAVLYGIDVLSPAIFGGPPDLVISGPNEGYNLGLITPHSGTVGAAVTALNKGIPAIAVSANRSDVTVQEAELIAALTLKIVEAIDGRHRIMLPKGIGLNVNIPDVDAVNSGVHHFTFKRTRVGLAADLGLQFYENLGDSPIARAYGMPADINLPGVSVEMPYTLAGHPEDTSRRSEGNAVNGLTVTVSPIQGTYGAKKVILKLRSLFHPHQ